MNHAKACQQNCGFARAAGIVGENWTMLILRQIMFLDQHHFDEIQRSLQISRHLLSTRLKRLIEAGILDKTQTESSSHSEYLLTPSGRELFSAFALLLEWGEKNSLNPGEIPVDHIHTTCGHQTSAEVSCSHCNQPLELGQFELVRRSADG